MTRARGSLGLGVVFIVGALAASSPPRATFAAAPVSAPPPAKLPGETSLAFLARSFETLPLSEARAVFRLAPLAGSADAPPETRESLTALLRSTLAGARLEATESLESAMTDARRRRSPLVFVEGRLERYALELEITEVGFARQFWQRALEPRGRKLWSRKIRVALDGSLVSRPKRPSFRAERLGSHAVPDILGVSCAAAESGTELVVAALGRRKLQTFGFDGTRLTARAERPLDELGPLSPTPLRQPIASIQPTERGWLLGSSDRAELFELTHGLEVLSRHPRAHPIDGTRCLAYREDGLDVASFPCTAPAGEPSKSSENTRSHREVWGFAGEFPSSSLAVRQSSRSFRIVVEGGGPRALEVWPGSVDATLLGIGAALAGAPTILVASAEAPTRPAEVSVFSLESPGELRRRESLPIGNARVLATCPPHLTAGSLTLLWTEKDIWVLR